MALGTDSESLKNAEHVKKGNKEPAWTGSFPHLNLILHGAWVHKMKSLEMDARTQNLFSQCPRSSKEGLHAYDKAEV